MRRNNNNQKKNKRRRRRRRENRKHSEEVLTTNVISTLISPRKRVLILGFSFGLLPRKRKRDGTGMKNYKMERFCIVEHYKIRRKERKKEKL